MTVYHNSFAEKSSFGKEPSFPAQRNRTSLPAGPVPYSLEDWMKRSFVSCKYYFTKELLTKPASIVTKVLNHQKISFSQNQTETHITRLQINSSMKSCFCSSLLVVATQNLRKIFPSSTLLCRSLLEMCRQFLHRSLFPALPQVGINPFQHFRRISENLRRLPGGQALPHNRSSQSYAGSGVACFH